MSDLNWFTGLKVWFFFVLLVLFLLVIIYLLWKWNQALRSKGAEARG